MQDDTRALEFLTGDSLGLRFYPIPQYAGAHRKYSMARVAYQSEVKGEKQALGHPGLIQTHGDVPQIKALDSCQHRLGAGSSGHALRVPGRDARGMGHAVWSLAGNLGFCRVHALYLAWPAGSQMGSEKQGGVH